MEVKCPFLVPQNGLIAAVLCKLDRGYLNNLSGLSLQGMETVFYCSVSVLGGTGKMSDSRAL